VSLDFISLKPKYALAILFEQIALLAYHMWLLACEGREDLGRKTGEIKNFRYQVFSQVKINYRQDISE